MVKKNTRQNSESVLQELWAMERQTTCDASELQVGWASGNKRRKRGHSDKVCDLL
jgi:hypothetical protein